ncbi:MAG: L,D-transpeptidase, partial [Pyrinomonadaceae bacterium]
MNLLKRASLLSLLITFAWAGTACVTQPSNSNLITTTTPSVAPTPSPAATSDVAATLVTLPVLDAFFASDETFAKELSSKVGLSDEQIEELRTAAREETSKLRENGSGEHAGTTEAARELAVQKIQEIVGEEKATQLFSFVRERWQAPAVGDSNGDASKTTGSAAEGSLPSVPNAVPTDTRVVVNSPAYRMDVFENGKLVKSYKVGIGYPEFPLPTGLRQAKAIIFNPTWTPPDEPWVESPSSKVRVGEKVEAGSKLNPLGLLKIPIGSPSL